MSYIDFLRGKIITAPVSGFSVRPEEINPVLKPHQRDAVMWACRGGRRALFESFGLGKTVQELEYARLVLDPFGGLGTVALEAIKSGRRGYTIELNDGYFRDAVGSLEAAEDELDTPTLFDLMGVAT